MKVACSSLCSDEGLTFETSAFQNLLRQFTYILQLQVDNFMQINGNIFHVVMQMCCSSGKLQKHKWENAMTVDKLSWGYRRNADIMDYLTIEELLYQLVSTVRLGNITSSPLFTGIRTEVPSDNQSGLRIFKVGIIVLSVSSSPVMISSIKRITCF